MKKFWKSSIGLGWLCGACLVWGVEGESNGVANASATNDSPALAETVVPEDSPEPAQKVAPVYRGTDMNAAFKGAGSSRFGINGRVNKIPAKKSAKKEKGVWRRNIEVGVNTSQGNSDTLRYNGSIAGSKETEANYYFLKAAGRYGESDGETDAANASGDAKAQRRLTERVYAAAEANAYHDEIADLAYRARGSLSLGRHFVWSERTVLSAEAGPGYVAEEKGGEKENFLAGRLAEYLEFLVTPSLQVWQSAELVQSLADASVYFINSEVGLETVLLANLNLRFTLEDRYDNAPAEGKKNNDLLTTTALVWAF